MAARGRAFPGNAPGSFFVDDSCIDCDTCRQVAPLSFVDAGGHAEVRAQPMDADALRAAARAVVCCPTASIGSDDAESVRAASGDFPLRLDAEVYHCGWHAASSYGATSYLLRRADGNWLVDSPRFAAPLAEGIARLGGLAGIYLTHRDDVADAARWAQRFGARRVVHEADADAVPGAETVLEGDAPTTLAPGLLAIPTPGHTAGHGVLLADDTHLFSGDHLWFSRRQGRLIASRSVCWHSWSDQTASVERLLAHRFAWVLPGHGQRVRYEPERMRSEIAALAARMRAEAAGDDW